MIISPEKDCTWTYHDGKLSINLTTDEGISYLFKTHYDVESLFQRPEINKEFSISDATYLTIFQEGVDKILNNEGMALDIGLNAVACIQFTRPATPTTRYFLPYGGKHYRPQIGDVVSLYTKTGNTADCLVLKELDADGLTRLMLLNPFIELEDNRGYKLGQMIRVRPDVVCEFRSMNGPQTVRYA